MSTWPPLGVVLSASPGPNAPMVFTSTSGGPTSAAIRSMSLAATAGSEVSAGLGGRGWRGHRARPGSERPARATGSDRRWRGRGRRGARHASSDEHGARRVTVYRTSQLRNQGTFPPGTRQVARTMGPNEDVKRQGGRPQPGSPWLEAWRGLRVAPRRRALPDRARRERQRA